MSKKAFTLIELLVVIAIIGVIVTIGIVSLTNARAKGRDAKRVADIKQVQTALELFFNDKGRYPSQAEFLSGAIYSTSTEGTTTYMVQIPEPVMPPDGVCTTANNEYIYNPVNDGTSYTIAYCIGNTTGALAGGPKCATPGAIYDEVCTTSGGSCTPNCTGKECGSDGCSGTCGTCSGTDVCNSGVCEAAAGDTFSCPGIPVVQYDGGPYDAMGINRNGGGYYRTVQIGAQCWLRDNLNVGTMITGTTVQDDNGIKEKFCYNNLESNCDTYGGLYEMAEAMQYGSLSPAAQGICPTGWHIPTDDELYTLESYLTVPGNSCLATRETVWDCDNAGSRLRLGGDTHFDAVGAGILYNGLFYYLGEDDYFWSSQTVYGPLAWHRDISINYGHLNSVYRGYGYYHAEDGMSIRCLKD